MARNYFAIEKPRTISISIQGYDAQARTTQQRRKQQERTTRLRRKQQRAASAQPTPPTEPACDQQDGEIEALSAAAAARTPLTRLEAELRQAFAGSEAAR